jgi:hypothetical protein
MLFNADSATFQLYRGENKLIFNEMMVPIGTIVQEKKMCLFNGHSEPWIACKCSFVCHINIWRNMEALPNVPVNHGFN